MSDLDELARARSAKARATAPAKPEDWNEWGIPPADHNTRLVDVPAITAFKFGFWAAIGAIAVFVVGGLALLFLASALGLFAEITKG